MIKMSKRDKYKYPGGSSPKEVASSLNIPIENAPNSAQIECCHSLEVSSASVGPTSERSDLYTSDSCEVLPFSGVMQFQ